MNFTQQVRSLTLLFALAFAGCTTSACELSEELNAIVRTTLAANGSLNKEKHERFWTLLENECDIKRSQALTDGLPKELGIETQAIALEFQTEVWKSARISLLRGEPIATPKLEFLKNSMLAKQREAASRFGNEADERAYMESFRKSWAESVLPNIDSLLLAASRKEGFESSSGEIVPEVNLDLIDTTVSHLLSGFERYKKLTNPNWSESAKAGALYLIATPVFSGDGKTRGDIYLELDLRGKKIPSGVIHTFDEVAGTYDFRNVSLRVEDFIVIASPVEFRGLRDNWCIDRTSLELWVGGEFMDHHEICSHFRKAEYQAKKVSFEEYVENFAYTKRNFSEELRKERFREELQSQIAIDRKLQNRQF